jgi:phage repressor protein C with HTH and peptisase S24 domain
VPPTKLSVATIRGDAMAPLLQEGDDIFVNHVIQRLVDRIYMISIDHQVSVKRVQWLPGNRLRLISENPAYPSYEVPTDSEDQAGFAIIGRVVWFGRLL